MKIGVLQISRVEVSPKSPWRCIRWGTQNTFDAFVEEGEGGCVFLLFEGKKYRILGYGPTQHIFVFNGDIPCYLATGSPKENKLVSFEQCMTAITSISDLPDICLVGIQEVVENHEG